MKDRCPIWGGNQICVLFFSTERVLFLVISIEKQNTKGKQETQGTWRNPNWASIWPQIHNHNENRKILLIFFIHCIARLSLDCIKQSDNDECLPWGAPLSSWCAQITECRILTWGSTWNGMLPSMFQGFQRTLGVRKMHSQHPPRTSPCLWNLFDYIVLKDLPQRLYHLQPPGDDYAQNQQFIYV